MRRRAQTAIEYLFMLAAALVLVLYAARVVLNGTRELTDQVKLYAEDVRRKILEDL
ncbi:MAG: hypothetical protein PWQ79_2012 [Thermococcaceae archaeon]|nr:hypothetical protein [Thermococcaceae archaeon]